MKEIGSPDATEAKVICLRPLCRLHKADVPTLSANDAVAGALRHEEPEPMLGLIHPTVVVRFDSRHPLSQRDKRIVKQLTGLSL